MRAFFRVGFALALISVVSLPARAQPASFSAQHKSKNGVYGAPALRFVQLRESVGIDHEIKIVPLPLDHPVIHEQRYAVVTLEKGPNNNLAFCKTILENNANDLLSFSSPETSPIVVYWPIRETTRELEKHNLKNPNCDELLELYDYDHAWEWQIGFDVFHLAGPRIISFDSTTGRSAFLDFSGYPIGTLADAIDKWKYAIWMNELLWNNSSADWVRTNVTVLYFRECMEEPLLLQLRFIK